MRMFKKLNRLFFIAQDKALRPQHPWLDGGTIGNAGASGRELARLGLAHPLLQRRLQKAYPIHRLFSSFIPASFRARRVYIYPKT